MAAVSMARPLQTDSQERLSEERGLETREPVWHIPPPTLVGLDTGREDVQRIEGDIQGTDPE